MPAVSATPKALARHALDALPDDASLEDVMEQLVLLHKIKVGLQQVRDGATVSLDEVEAHRKRLRDEKLGE